MLFVTLLGLIAGLKGEEGVCMGEGGNGYSGEIHFVKEIERLKNTKRTAWTSTGRQESTAEHSFRLALLLYVLQDHFSETDLLKALGMALVHDLGEAYAGDISAVLKTDSQRKFEEEKASIEKLVQSLPPKIAQQILDLFLEYNAGLTPEAKLVKSLDKIETIIQHNQGQNPPDFDYAFNLHYGKDHTDAFSVTKSIRSLLDLETEERGNAAKRGPLNE